MKALSTALLIGAVLLSNAAAAQANEKPFVALTGRWGIDREICSDPDGTYQITQSSIRLFGDVQCAIKRRSRIGKSNAWQLDLQCKTVDQGNDVRQTVLMLDDSGDLYEYSRGTMERRVKCPVKAN